MQLKPVQPLLPPGQTQARSSAERPLEFDAEAYTKRFNSLTRAGRAQRGTVDDKQVDASRDTLRKTTVVPLMPAPAQIKMLEFAKLGQKKSSLSDDTTVAGVLDLFSFHPTDEQVQATSKLAFIDEFIRSIRSHMTNFELAIVCHSARSETKLLNRLSTIQPTFIMRELSSFASFNNLYGVIIQISKYEKKKNHVIVKPNVSLIFIYEPVMGPLPHVEQLFNACTKIPRMLSLVTINSAEQRFYEQTYNAPRIQLDARLSKVPGAERSTVFKQSIKAVLPDDATLWNKSIASDVAHWARGSQQAPYIFDYDRLFSSVSWRLGRSLGFTSSNDCEPPKAGHIGAMPIAIPAQQQQQSQQSTKGKGKKSKSSTAGQSAHTKKPSNTKPVEVNGRSGSSLQIPPENSVQKRALDKSDAPAQETTKKAKVQQERKGKQDEIKRKAVESNTEPTGSNIKTNSESSMEVPTEPMEVDKEPEQAKTKESQSESNENSIMPDLASIFQAALSEFEQDLQNIKANL
ncbi:hypothetical protein A0J61_03507 [Choanephora cucurbitarum]|uniref:Uncharacterized protein n=1 Tax=Choanephora cucurbitarum TaxID=101091 RepID=A0A1C7NH72_9FUNG|nr:hypothetical protein A0J61_03507 [Choanephora cucurbitarum]